MRVLGNWVMFAAATMITMYSTPYAQASTGSTAHGADFRTIIYKAAVKRSARGDEVVSPVGLAQLLGMLRLGSRGNTQAQIDGFLAALPGSPCLNLRDDSAFSCRNSLWIDTQFTALPSFKTAVRQSYGAAIFDVPFASAKTGHQINAWVTRATSAQIASFPLPRSTTFLALNIVSFHGRWRHSFNVNRTRTQPFRSYGHIYPIPMMQQSVKVPYLVTRDGQIALLPLSKGLWFAVYLPVSRLPRAAWLERLSAALMNQHIEPTTLDLSIPRLSVRSRVDYVSALKDSGITDAFDPSRADFTPIFGKPRIALTYLFQIGALTIDERGTNASVASAAITTQGLVKAGRSFVCNRPFAFAIVDANRQHEIFAGVIEHP